MSNEMQLYRQFCRQAPPDFPVFMQDWYLDAVCEGGEWQAIVHRINLKTVGVWPIFLKKKAIWKYIAMPQMGKLMGPFIVPEMREVTQEMRILEAMIAQLPPNLVAFEQDFNYTITNWLPLYWKGFSQTTRYSYRLSLALSQTTLWDNIASNYKRKIKKAQQLIDIVTALPTDQLFQLCSMSFARQQIKFPLSKAYFYQIYDAFSAHQAGKAFYALDKNSGEIHAAIFLVWDQSSAYLLWSGEHPELRKSGAGVALQWEAILYTKNTLNLPIFDFEGSMIESIEQGRRYLGAQQIPYFRIRKEWSALWRWSKFLFR